MKAALVTFIVASVLGVVAGLTTADVCTIPSQYATGALGKCDGPQPGYIIQAQCTTLNDIAAVPKTLPLDQTTKTFFQDPAAALSGCLLSGLGGASAFAVAMGDLGFGAPGGFTCDPTASAQVLSLKIQCDQANGYYPTNGVEGSQGCLAPAFAGIATMPVSTTGYFATIPQGAGATALDGTNALRCSKGCVLDEAICRNGRFNDALVFWTDSGNQTALIPGTCLVRPGTTLRVAVKNDLNMYYRYTCTPAATAPFAGVGAWDANGAPMVPRWGAIGAYLLGDKKREALAGTLSAGHLETFPSVTSTLVNSAPRAGVAQFEGLTRYLRAAPNVAVDFASGVAQTITVTGCENAATQVACTQAAINAWRCRGYNVDSGTICLADWTRIACPTDGNGWECPTSGSKKGLLGLLGLLGLIPLLLCSLLLCLLFPCCIRRKKTEGDVHFATFDPHAAPVVATAAPVATAVGVDPCAYGGVPATAFAPGATAVF